ncbi:DcaP family trimeric outer membrane transporter [uncultured Alistipes sp.]|uniref:DcaP family trimeric outer membrane transporter n=1 Tax=uncultured Alistipes sp. TaxID=538949 RepID=UPI00258B651E|nr:DcaP family trimeric outer membrane transporter [uncultured Alistipes sp.]
MTPFRFRAVPALLAALLAASAAAQPSRPSSRPDGENPAAAFAASHSPATSGRHRTSEEEDARRDHAETHRRGFQQHDRPQFVFSSKENRFSFSLGGFVALRAAYDAGGIVENIDFVTYDIPVAGNYATRQKLTLDASTSRLFLKAIANTRAVGRVVIYLDGDFRGGAANSYTPRLRSAYVSLLGLTLGRDVTTFCDLEAAPATVDFQGPNAYNFNFATLVRYERSFAEGRLSFGVAAEMPVVSGTYGEGFDAIPQRVPDIPFYVQYAWGGDRSSHIRASAVVRNMYLHDLTRKSDTSLTGWGVQFSGTIRCCDPLRLFMNGVYGKGITPYIQDLTGSGLDFTPCPRDETRIRTMPMWGWQAAAQIALTPRLFLSGGYSTVRVQRSHGFYAADEYKRGQYVFGNVFYTIAPRCKVAGEYLYGSRRDMAAGKGHANRVNVMLQYGF